MSLRDFRRSDAGRSRLAEMRGGATSGRIPILFVHHRGERGGAPTSLSYLIQELDKERYEPHVYCPPGFAVDLFRETGATVHTGPVAGFTHIWASVYRGRRWILFVRELLHLPRHLIHFRRVLRQRDFAIVHLNDSPLIPAAILARRRGIPVVWHLRSALPYQGIDRRSRFMRRVIRRLATVSIAINDDVAGIFDVGATVIRNTVDLERFQPGDAEASRSALGLDRTRATVGFFGFIYPSKGFREFITAAAQIRERGVEANYLIVGGAVRDEAFFGTWTGRWLQRLDLARNYEREAKDLVGELGLEDCVRFVPFTPDPANIYRACNVVVAPSTGPELGRPVIEAAASGVPVVASGSRTGGGVIIHDETGVLAESPTAETLAATVAALLEDPERRSRLGIQARRHAELSFDPVANARRVEAIYRRLVPAYERQRVLYVHHRPQLGGAPASLVQLIRNLDRRFEPHVYVPEGPAARFFAEAGATVHTGPVSTFSHTWDSPYERARWLVLSRELVNLPGHVLRLRRLLKEIPFSIVHLNDSPLLPAAFVAHRRRLKVVWHLRSALAGEGKDRRARAIGSLIDRYGDAAIAIDRDVLARFPITLPTEIIPNSVDFPRNERDQKQARIELGLPADHVLIGIAGFIRRQKGWPEFVTAAARLEREGLPAHYVVAGGGIRPPEYFRTVRGRVLSAVGIVSDEESAITRQVAELNLQHRFTFLPFTVETGIIFSALDIVSFPNRGVGLGRPVLEAAAYGKPVVASGSRDGADLLLDGRTGVLLHEASANELADALSKLVCDPELRRRLGSAARAHAKTTFDGAVNARRVEALYDQLLSADSKGSVPRSVDASEPARAEQRIAEVSRSRR
jgi:glycosyltransferase involved in cell wall biosynthesis